jgi:hypothetical protein
VPDVLTYQGSFRQNDVLSFKGRDSEQALALSIPGISNIHGTWEYLEVL